MQIGDKVSGRYGNKGVVASIYPDDQMPHDVNGEPFEMAMSPLGTVSRTNPGAAAAEIPMGKLAKKLGHPINIDDLKLQLPEDFRDKIDIIEMTATEESSSTIRDRVIRGLPIQSMTTPEIVDYIRNNKLYK